MTWVLLRGLTREARHWGAFPHQLAHMIESVQATPDAGKRQVVALDLPGNGEFCGTPSPRSVPDMVDFARQQLLAKGFHPRSRLVAMSLGGMVATHWAQRYPHEVDSLVLINTSMRPYSHATERLLPRHWLQLAWLAARWPDPASADHAERLIHQLTCRNLTAREEDLASWVRIRQNAPVTSANAGRQLWAAARFTSAAGPLHCPTLVLSSAGDELVHPRCSARLAQAWHAEHHEHPWAGHDLPHDDPDWVCQRIADWFGKI